MKTPHKHAALIKAWADGAIIQAKDPSYEDKWGIIANPRWNEYMDYRIKPETIRIGNVDVPKPLDSLEGITEAFEPSLSYNSFFIHRSPKLERLFCARLIRRGLLHSSKENAIIHAKALIAISGGVT